MTRVLCEYRERSFLVEFRLVHPHMHNVHTNWLLAVVDTGATRSHVENSVIPSTFPDDGKKALSTTGVGSVVSFGGNKDNPARQVISKVYRATIEFKTTDGQIFSLQAGDNANQPGYSGVISTEFSPNLIGFDIISSFSAFIVNNDSKSAHFELDA
ncbi:MAG: hypothetical protein RLN60_03355 [Phycisphaerales bacterium]